jgi:truncated hemoglobin YjbI
VQRQSEEVLKTGSNIITDMLNKDPEQPVSNIFKNQFSEAKYNLDQKIKKMTGSALSLKKKSMFKKVQSQSKRRKVKDIFREAVMECLKSGLDIFLKRSIQTSTVNSYTVTNL